MLPQTCISQLEVDLGPNIGDKKNVTPYKKFNLVEAGHGSHPKEKNKGEGRKTLRCWTCGGEHRKRDFPSHQDGRALIYSAQEAHIIGYVGQSIPWIYVVMDKKKEDHQTSIIEIEGKICDEVFSMLIDPRSNYSHISPDFVDKYCLNKEVHA